MKIGLFCTLLSFSFFTFAETPLQPMAKKSAFSTTARAEIVTACYQYAIAQGVILETLNGVLSSMKNARQMANLEETRTIIELAGSIDKMMGGMQGIMNASVSFSNVNHGN